MPVQLRRGGRIVGRVISDDAITRCWCFRRIPGGIGTCGDLLPGTYFVLASDDVDDAQWANADYLEQYRARATRVTLQAGERKSIVLTTNVNP